MSGDVLGVYVEFLKDGLRQGTLHARSAAPVEALRVCQQIERDLEELAADFQLAGGVGELPLDLSLLPLDGRQLRLDLGSRPIRVVQQLQEAVFLGVQLVQASVEALLEGAQGRLLAEERIVQLTPNISLERVAKSDRAEVLVHRQFDLGDRQVRQVAAVLLAARQKK